LDARTEVNLWPPKKHSKESFIEGVSHDLSPTKSDERMKRSLLEKRKKRERVLTTKNLLVPEGKCNLMAARAEETLWKEEGLSCGRRTRGEGGEKEKVLTLKLGSPGGKKRHILLRRKKGEKKKRDLNFYGGRTLILCVERRKKHFDESTKRNFNPGGGFFH